MEGRQVRNMGISCWMMSFVFMSIHPSLFKRRPTTHPSGMNQMYAFLYLLLQVYNYRFNIYILKKKKEKRKKKIMGFFFILSDGYREGVS